MNRDQDVMIDEIMRRVRAKLAALEGTAPVAGQGAACCVVPEKAAEAKPRIMILTRDHGDICHQMLECPELSKYFTMECALSKGCYCVKDCEAVVAFELSLEDLGKITAGIFDDEYRKALGTALLCGKKVFMPRERVELLNLGVTAPTAYYRAIEENLRTLKNSGLTLVEEQKLGAAVINGVPHSAKFSTAASFNGAVTPLVVPAAKAADMVPAQGATVAFAKRVLTERSVKEAAKDGVAQMNLSANTIVTDLARDYAARFRIRLVKEEE